MNKESNKEIMVEEEKRAKFLKIYANVPDGLREDILVVVDNKTYTWNTSYIEIRNNTELGKKILKTLENIGVIRTKKFQIMR